MTRHACAVILLGGWLLMLPPVEKAPDPRVGISGWRARTEAAIAEWEQYGAYDTASACEAAKDRYTDDRLKATASSRTKAASRVIRHRRPLDACCTGDQGAVCPGRGPLPIKAAREVSIPISREASSE